MLKDHVKRDISDFLDGELSSEAQDKLFSDSETAAENLEYLQTLRLIKRGEGELSEPAPEKLKSSVLTVVGKTVVLKKKATVFTAIWVTLAVILAVALIWVIFFPVKSTTHGDGPVPPSSSTVSGSAPSGTPSDVSGEPSDTESGSGEVSGSEPSSGYDYSEYLPFGIDDYLPQEYRGEKYAFVVSAKGTYVATLMENNKEYVLLYNEPGELAILTSTKSLEATLKDLGATWFAITETVTDELFEGIQSGAATGIVFVRA